MNHACDEVISASKSFARRRARFTHPTVRSTIQRFGKTINPLTSRSARLTQLSHYCAFSDIKLAEFHGFATRLSICGAKTARPWR